MACSAVFRLFISSPATGSPRSKLSATSNQLAAAQMCTCNSQDEENSMNRYPKTGASYTYGRPPRRPISFPRWLGIAFVLTVAGLVFSYPLRPQQQQSGGAGSSVSINAALPTGTNVI